MVRIVTFAALFSIGSLNSLADVELASTEQFAKRIGSEGTLLVDVRTPAETAEGKIEGAIEINFNAPDFEQQILQLPADKTYLLYCRSGNRSGQAATLLDEMGYQNLVNLDGGIIAWKAEGRPILSSRESETDSR